MSVKKHDSNSAPILVLVVKICYGSVAKEVLSHKNHYSNDNVGNEIYPKGVCWDEQTMTAVKKGFKLSQFI